VLCSAGLLPSSEPKTPNTTHKMANGTAPIATSLV
jgi:hypothetical protein